MPSYRIRTRPGLLMRLWRAFFPKEEPWVEGKSLAEVMEDLPKYIEKDTLLEIKGVRDTDKHPPVTLQIRNGVKFTIVGRSG